MTVRNTTSATAVRRSPVPITHAGAYVRAAETAARPAGLDADRLAALAEAWFARAAAALWLWRERARERRALRGLDDHQLADIGVTRAEAEAEGRKPFWRP